MNLYLRYFDNETLVYNVDEALNWLASIREITIDAQLEREVRDYVQSDMMYPKRYKVRPRIYFIIIKTTAATMSDFKQKKALNPVKKAREEGDAAEMLQALVEVRPGWYDVQLDFKRVVLTPRNGKFAYKDTHVEYQLKAESPIDAYNRAVDYLSTRVDSRSQFPSAKGKNFKYTYLGTWK